MSHRVQFPGAFDNQLAGRLHHPSGTPIAWALFAHCFTCSKDLRAAIRIADSVAQCGIGVLRFDFTGLGGSEGDFADTTFSSNIEDLIAAADYMRTHHEAPRILIGHSLGGAAVLAAAPHIPESKAVATIGAPADPAHVRHLLAPAVAEIEQQGLAEVDIAGRRFRIRRAFLDDLEQHDLEQRVGNLRRALLVCHAPGDTIVGVDNARMIFSAAKHPKSFLSLDDADHLLSKTADAAYAGNVIANWSLRYASDAPASDTVAEGLVRVRGSQGGLAHDIVAGRHRLRADEPESIPGGTDTGPTPYGLLLSALGACTAMTMRMYAERKQWPLEDVEITLKHEKIHARDCEDCETASGKIDQISRDITVSGPLDDTQRQRLREIADKCPVHKTLHSEVKIVTHIASDTTAE